MKITIEKGQNIFFTSDTHYAHKNICRATTEWKRNGIIDTERTRDFTSLEAMNDAIVNGINERVKEDDYLIHLGDWSFGGFNNIIEFRKRINCKNIILFYGNHDHHIRKNKDGVQGYFRKTLDYDLLDISVLPGTTLSRRYSFVCFHYPIASWDSMNSKVMHLHGHVHLPPSLKIAAGRAMDVGVEGNNYSPYSLNEVIDILKDRPVKKLSLPSDHHEGELI